MSFPFSIIILLTYTDQTLVVHRNMEYSDTTNTGRASFIAASGSRPPSSVVPPSGAAAVEKQRIRERQLSSDHWPSTPSSSSAGNSRPAGSDWDADERHEDAGPLLPETLGRSNSGRLPPAYRG